jgi:hypothetical protein
MNAIQRHMGLMLSGVIAAAGIWACTATRQPDGSVTVEFAPDMVINARGLEGLLRGLEDLLASCVSGTFPRPCSDGEMDAIVDALDRLARRKQRIAEPPTPSGPARVG